MNIEPDPVGVSPFGQVVGHARVALVRVDGVEGRHEGGQLQQDVKDVNKLDRFLTNIKISSCPYSLVSYLKGSNRAWL